MVKVKNKKNFGQADKLHAKKSQSKSKRNLNPFEVHINKEKFKVLGKKSKNDWGLPGVSRAKALKKRKNTLGHELKLVNKTNTFLDKRIGEKNVALSEEDKISARFAVERIQQHKMKSEKQSIYNLAEDEVLTHRGQTLEEIEKFDDPRSDDEEDEEMDRNQSGNLRDGFVADANFGGGVLTRNENKDGALSRKDLIEQLIIESKKRKMEKQKLKEETLDLTEKLDTEWKDLQPVVAKDFNKAVEMAKPPETPSIIDKLLSEYDKKNEDYDKMMRELKFEPRGTPSDRLKSEDEIAKVEKEKLEKLEQDRLARMHGTANINNAKPKHRSADDLDDDFEIDSDPEMMVAYNSEGKVIMPERFEKQNDENGDENSDEDGNSNDDGDNGDENDNNEGSEQENENESADESDEDSLCDLREPDQGESSSDDEKDTKNDKQKIERVLNISGINKLKNEIDPSIEKHETVKPKEEIMRKKSETVKEEEPIKKENNVNSEVDKIKADLMARKAMMEKAAAELPYTFSMPKNYEALQELLEKHPPDYQFIIVERIIKCNHPKLGEGNKVKLGTLFAYLLQYVNDLFCEESISTEDDLLNSFRCFDRLSTHFFDLAQMDTENTKTWIIGIIKEKYEEYKKKSTIFPQLDTLIFLKLVSLLFPTSDLKHPVVSPCFIFISLILTTCKVKTNKDLARGLFVTTLVSEYTVLSKRILPAAFNFIRGSLFLCVPTMLDHQIKVLHPFKPYGPKSNLLVLNSKNAESDNTNQWKMMARHLINDNQDDDFKIRVLVTTIKILNDFFQQSNDLAIQPALFEHHIDLLPRIPKTNYPESVVKLLNETVETMEKVVKNKTFEPLVAENKKPKSLKLYEPAVEKQFNGKSKKNMSREKIEHEKLVYKHKKEMKGALREIRRDRSFIGAVKLKEKIQSDNVRKEKVKRIYSEASMQQGELNAMQRSKKKKK